MQSKLSFVAPLCTCCGKPAALLPRMDLPGDLSACPNSGQLYQRREDRYAPTDMPALVRSSRRASSVKIDLSRASYA